MNGHWQFEVPSKDGWYWTATRSGEINRPLPVAYDGDRLVYAGGAPKFPDPNIADSPFNYDSTWKGLWWSEPLEVPPPPS